MGSNDGNSYRKELKDLLTKDGITIDYIGTVKNGNIPDNDNEGHSGATIAQISGYADTPLRQKPQVRRLVSKEAAAVLTTLLCRHWNRS
jgi:hypothetical protein